MDYFEVAVDISLDWAKEFLELFQDLLGSLYCSVFSWDGLLKHVHNFSDL